MRPALGLTSALCVAALMLAAPSAPSAAGRKGPAEAPAQDGEKKPARNAGQDRAKAPARDVPTAQSCASYDQTQSPQGIDLSLRNSCDTPLRCSIRWTLTCQTRTGRSVHREASRFELMEHESHSVTASIAACGAEASWRIGDIRWSCRVDESIARRPDSRPSRGRAAP